MNTTGSLVVVGTGIGLAGQITLISKSYIENADVVYGVLPDQYADAWITGLNANYVSLQSLYAEGKSRKETYNQMVETILEAVRAGKKVVGAFYGHAGVFAWAPHEVIKRAKKEGFSAHMEPGISAEDCLYADLGIDPGLTGCQAFETTQLLFFNHTVDPTCYLILWQISIAGEHTLKTLETSPQRKLELAVEFLSRWYPADHKVVIYEAPFLPTEKPRMDWIRLEELPTTQLNMSSTLVLPPSEPLKLNQEALQKFGLEKNNLGFF